MHLPMTPVLCGASWSWSYTWSISVWTSQWEPLHLLSKLSPLNFSNGGLDGHAYPALNPGVWTGVRAAWAWALSCPSANLGSWCDHALRTPCCWPDCVACIFIPQRDFLGVVLPRGSSYRCDMGSGKGTASCWLTSVLSIKQWPPRVKGTLLSCLTHNLDFYWAWHFCGLQKCIAFIEVEGAGIHFPW